MYFKIKIINGLHQRFLQSLTKKIGLSISNISQTYILTLNIFDNNKVRPYYFDATLLFRILNWTLYRATSKLTTVLMWGMSRPRAATSVATRTVNSCFLNAEIISFLSVWNKSPWIHLKRQQTKVIFSVRIRKSVRPTDDRTSAIAQLDRRFKITVSMIVTESFG